MATQVAERPEAEEATKPLVVLRAQLEQRASEFAMVLPAHISPDRFQRTLLTAVQQSPELMRCERRSFLTACFKAAQDGLLPDGREAAIVPFKHRYKDADGWHQDLIAQYMPMLFGLRKKILQSGEVTDLHADVVYRQELDAGRFVYEEGAEATLRYKPILDPDFRPTDEDVALAFSVAKFKDGSKSFEVLRRWQIDDIRETSQTGAQFDRNGNRREAKGPWVEWFPEMAKKSVVRRHSKSLPQSGDVLPDVEGEDLAFAAQSAVALLDSQKADPPRRLLPDDPPLSSSPERPRLPEDAPTQTPERPPDEQLTPDLAEQSGPEAEEGGEGTAPPPPDPNGGDAQEDGSVADEQPEDRLTEAPQPAPIQPPETDDYGLTKDPEEALAEDYMKRAKSCELLVDFKKLETEAEALPLEAMRGDLQLAVEEEFARARLRLTPKEPVE